MVRCAQSQGGRVRRPYCEDYLPANGRSVTNGVFRHGAPTAISTITGGLQYRGYMIEDLGENATFEEVAYLLLHGVSDVAAEAAGARSRAHRVGQFLWHGHAYLPYLALVQPRALVDEGVPAIHAEQQIGQRQVARLVLILKARISVLREQCLPAGDLRLELAQDARCLIKLVERGRAAMRKTREGSQTATREVDEVEVQIRRLQATRSAAGKRAQRGRTARP